MSAAANATPATPVAPTPPAVLLAHHRKELRRPTCLRVYEQLALQCTQEGVDHARYVSVRPRPSPLS